MAHRSEKFLLIPIIFYVFQINSFSWQQGPLLRVDIPDSIIQKIDIFIKSKVGEKYFNSFIKLDTIKSNFRQSYRITHPSSCAEKLKSPHYLLIYNISVPDMGAEVAEIDLISDTLGNLISDCYIDKTPVCPDNDCWNYFPVVKKEDAIKIAKDAGLEEGIKDWIISFHFDFEDSKAYVWDIKTTLSGEGTYSDQGASGKGILVSSIDGLVIRIYNWAAIK